MCIWPKGTNYNKSGERELCANQSVTSKVQAGGGTEGLGWLGLEGKERGPGSRRANYVYVYHTLDDYFVKMTTTTTITTIRPIVVIVVQLVIVVHDYEIE